MTIVVGSQLRGLLGALDQAVHGSAVVESMVRAADVLRRITDDPRPIELLVLDDRLQTDAGQPLEDMLWYIVSEVANRTPKPRLTLLVRDGIFPPMVMGPLQQLVTSLGGEGYTLPSRPTPADEQQAVAFVLRHVQHVHTTVQRWVMPLSSAGGAGKTTQMANIALAARQRGLRVMVIDADFANGSLSMFFRVPPGEIHPFVTLAEEMPHPRDTYPLPSVTRRIYTHACGIDLLVSGRGLADFGDMTDHGMACLLNTVRMLPYDLIVLDTGPDIKARPYTLRVLADGGYGVVIVQAGRKERSGASSVLTLLGQMTLPGANESLLSQLALLGVASERGSRLDIVPVYDDLLQRFNVHGLGIVPRDAALISEASEASHFVSVFDLSPRGAYCRAIQQATDSLLDFMQIDRPLPSPAQSAWWQRWFKGPTARAPHLEGKSI